MVLTNAMTSHALDLSPGVGQSTGLISLDGCNPTRLVKDEEKLQARKNSLTPSQIAFQLMTTNDQLFTATIAVCD